MIRKEIKEWGFYLLIIGLLLVIYFFGDSSFLDNAFLTLLVGGAIWALIIRYRENETFKKKNALTLEHVNDNHRQVFSWMVAGGGILLQIYWFYIDYSFDWYSLFTFLITVCIFLNGALFPRSVFLWKEGNHLFIKNSEKTFKFTLTDIDFFIKRTTITGISKDENGTNQQVVRNLELSTKDESNFRQWQKQQNIDISITFDL